MNQQEREDLTLGQQAKGVLNDPAFVRASRDLATQYVREWRSSKSVDDRERIHAKAAALEDLINELRTILGRGEVLEQRSDKEAAARQKKEV